VVDSFIGALPEAAMREFVAGLAPAESEADRLAERSDEASLRPAFDLAHDHATAVVALAELLADRGEGDEALTLLTRVPETAETRRVAALARLGDSVEGNVDSRLQDPLDRVKDDEDARREYVDLLEILGSHDPRTPRYRRALPPRLYRAPAGRRFRWYSFGQWVGLGGQRCSARLLWAEALESRLARHTEDIADVGPCSPAIKGGVHRVTEGNARRVEGG
jgi:hypothetical protein